MQPHLANIFNISKVLVDMLMLNELDRFPIYNESSSDHLEILPDLEEVRKVQSRKSRMVEHAAHNARNIFGVVMNQVIILKAYLTWKKREKCKQENQEWWNMQHIMPETSLQW
jgi:hypothetical protein